MSTPTELERVVEAIGIATYGGRSFEATGVYRDKLEKIVTTYAKTVAEEAVAKMQVDGHDMQKVGDHYWGGDYFPQWAELERLAETVNNMLNTKV